MTRIKSCLWTMIALAATVPDSLSAAPGDLSTVAGSGPVGGSQLFAGDGGPATSATIDKPNAIAFDPSDGSYYICTGNRVRRVDSSGVITTVAGTGPASSGGDGGLATSAQIHVPQGVAIDAAGNLFIAESFGQRVRRVDAATGIITTIAGDGTPGNTGDGGQAGDAQISPVGMEFDPHGNLVIACSNVVRRILAGGNGTIESTDTIERIAGTGASGSGADGIAATLSSLQAVVDVAFDPDGDLYISDLLDHRIRKVEMDTMLISTVAGDGVAGFVDGVAATAGRLNEPAGIEVDASFNLFIVDSKNQRIRKVFAVDQTLSTIGGTGNAGFAGDGGPASLAEFNTPFGIAFDSTQNLLFSDLVNHRIRRIEAVASFAPVAPLYRPDNLVGKKPARLVGNNRYGGLAGQRVLSRIKRGRQTRLFYRIENDGNTNDRFRSRVTRGTRRRFLPRWIALGRNVTGAMQTAGYVTPVLDQGAAVLVLGRIRIRTDRGGSAYRFRCTSETDAAKFDSALARLRVQPRKKKRL